MPVQELQERTTSSEFVMWMAFLDWETNSFHREDFYWAAIRRDIVAAFSSGKKRLDLEDFILKFQKEEKEKGKEAVKIDSKQAWLKMLGIKEK